MRRLLIVRHAIAHQRNVQHWPDDADRPLTKIGKKKFERVARRVGSFLDKPELLFTSPLTRARQTARILRREADFPKPKQMGALRPGGGSKRVIDGLREADAKFVAIVGHEPDLSELISELLVGSPSTVAGSLKKGGLVVLEFSDDIQSGKASLAAYVPPRLLAARKS
jgi:phosphohistidine phosphatase